jgi:hypothetical protein
MIIDFDPMYFDKKMNEFNDTFSKMQRESYILYYFDQDRHLKNSWIRTNKWRISSFIGIRGLSLMNVVNQHVVPDSWTGRYGIQVLKFMNNDIIKHIETGVII